MGDPRMIIRIAANVTELKRNLAEGKSQVEALSASVEKIAKSFDGTKLIQNANNITAAIDKIGGASKLTEAEQARVNATLEKAIQKYQALGKEAPAAMTALYNATKKVDDATTGAANGTGLLGGAVGKLAAGFAVGSLIDKAVTGIFNLGKEAFDTAGMVVDLSKKTGLSTTAVQQFGFVASQGGSTLEKWADTIFKAGVNIETGSDKVRHGIAGLGLEYDRIKALKPEAQFDAIMRALANIESPQERNRLGVEALGKGYADVAASVDDYIEQIGRAPVASDEAIRATDEAADAIGAAWKQAEAIAINAIGGILAAWAKADKGAEKAREQSARGVGSQTMSVNPFGNTGARGAVIIDPNWKSPADIAAEAAKAAAATSAAVKTTAEAVKTYTERLAAARAELAKLTPVQKAQIDAALKLGVSMEDLGDQYKLSADAQKLYSDRTKASTTVDQQAARVKEFLQREEIARNADLLKVWESQVVVNKTVQDKIVKDFLARVAAMKAGEAAYAAWLKAQQAQSAKDTEAAALEALNRAAAAYKEKQQALADGAQTAAEKQQALANTLYGVANAMSALAGETDGALSSMLDFGAQALSIMASLASGNYLQAAAQGIQLIGQAIKALRPEGAKVNDLRDEFVAGAGGAEALYAQLQRIGRLDLWQPLMAGRGRLEDIEDAIGDVEGAIEALDEAMSRYGLSLDDAGTATERAQRATQRLTTDFEALRKAGFSVQQVTAGAASQLNGLIAAALEAGTKLPASLGPYVEELIRTGGLTDELKRKLLGVADPVPWQQMQADAEKYGIAIGALGKQFEQAKLDSIVAELSGAWTRFTDNGADATGVMEGMKDEVSELVRKALELGLTIPDSMKPLIEAMDKAGLLTDKNGEKLEGLGELKWAEPVVSEVDKLIAKMDELIEKIINGVVPALGEVTAPEFDGGRTGSTPGRRPNRAHSGALVLADGIRRYHAGSANVLPFPRMTRDEFPAILQTGEAVLNRRAVQAVGTDAIGAMNTGRGVGAQTITFAPVVNVHPSPGMNERDLAMRTVEQIAKGAGLDKLKRAVNG